MKILDKIIHDKKIEIKTLSDIVPVSDLEKQKDFTKKCKSLKESIKKSKSGIICEFKRKSPSNGNINYTSNISDVIKGYEKAGAVGVSILTNKKYFDGSISDINDVKTSIEIPILRKEFVISEYQIIEAKSIGSDSILLIASILSKEQIKNYSSLAKSLGLEVLLEIHSIDELNEVSKYDIDIIGVNNRNLDTLEIDIKNSIEIFKENFPETSANKVSVPQVRGPISSELGNTLKLIKWFPFTSTTGIVYRLKKHGSVSPFDHVEVSHTQITF